MILPVLTVVEHTHKTYDVIFGASLKALAVKKGNMKRARNREIVLI